MTRHELKEQIDHDQFRDAVSGTIEYAALHRKTLINWAIVAGIVLILAGGLWLYSSHQRTIRQQALESALVVAQAPVGPASEYGKTYPTQEAKNQAAVQALSEVISKYGGTREGLIAQYYRGTVEVQQNQTQKAESDLKTVVDSKSQFAPLAKIALAQLYASSQRLADARSLLQSIINKPSGQVSKSQAQLLLAQLEQVANPKDAKSLLDSLRRSNPSPATDRAIDQISNPENQ